MQILSNPISAIDVRESPKFSIFLGNWGRETRCLKEIGAEEHDGDVRFKNGSGNVAVSCMRNASGHEQFVHCGLGYGTDITERISSC